ncbi:MAG: prepilin-type N-terminal cleavage/methylation domain-containing protein [bacterium]|nr:prepilin-type N-terminal cleavage/methylation domain-containing protein [bacterium]
MNSFFDKKGFTLFEVVIVVSVLGILSAMVIGGIVFFQKKTELNNAVQEFAAVLRLAQTRALASEQESQYGVYINTSLAPNEYVLFKGVNYASRIASFDQVYPLPKTVEFSQVNLVGGEITFEKLTGFASQAGSISLRLIQDTAQAKTIYISDSGTVDFSLVGAPSDSARIKDSRHVHFDYSRVINTATENVVLTFNGTTVQTLPIASNMATGQFYWQGTVTAGGTPQTVTVQTHRLNAADTQFSIHRDRSLNDKTFRVTLSGDASGNLANYSADGVTVTHSSIYVSNFIWQ